MTRVLLSALALIGAILAASFAGSADAADSSGCTKRTLIYQDGSQKPALGPPTPQGTITRLSNGRFRFTWRFATLPARCRPRIIAFGLKFEPPGTNLFFKRPVTARSGTYTTIPLPGTLASKVIYGKLYAEGRTLTSETRRLPLRQR